MFKSPSKILTTAAMILALGSGPAMADPSLVKLSTSGNATYDITGVQQIDWQSSGDLVVVNKLPFPAANGKTTFSTWIAAAQPGDTVTFNVNFHARMNDLLDSGGGSVAPDTLSKNGVSCIAGSGCFEVTDRKSVV